MSRRPVRMPTILSLARRYKAGQMTREELLNILGQFNYRVPSNHGLGYSDLPDQGAWRARSSRRTAPATSPTMTTRSWLVASSA